MKRSDFCNLVKRKVGASGCEPVYDLVRLATESSTWVLRGYVFNNKRTAIPMEQIGAENETNSNPFVSKALMNDDQIMYVEKWDDLSDEEIFKYGMNGVGETMRIINEMKAVFIDEAIVIAFLIFCLLDVGSFLFKVHHSSDSNEPHSSKR
jgi:hypothetical protein